MGSDSRKLKPKDWVKFAHDLSKGRKSGRQEDIIARYKEAWKELYDSQPPMVDSFPKRFIADPNYQPEVDIPWFKQDHYQHLSETVGDAQNACKSISSSLDQSTTLGPLMQHLKEDIFELDMSYPNPGIKGGLLDGFAAHLKSPISEKLRVVFIIVPEYRLKKGYRENSAFSVASIGKEDHKKIYQACQNAIQKDKDQKGCKPGQIRCFMNGWVTTIYFQST